MRLEVPRSAATEGGLKGLDRWSHSLFWGMLLNVTCYVGVSLFTRQSDAEMRQAEAQLTRVEGEQRERKIRPCFLGPRRPIIDVQIGRPSVACRLVEIELLQDDCAIEQRFRQLRVKR